MIFFKTNEEREDDSGEGHQRTINYELTGREKQTEAADTNDNCSVASTAEKYFCLLYFRESVYHMYAEDRRTVLFANSISIILT